MSQEKPLSLMAQAEQETFTMPAIFGEGSNAVDVQGRNNTATLVFAHPLANEYWMRIMMKYKDVEEAQQFLLQPDPLPLIKVTPARISIIAAKQYWCEENSSGEILRTYFESRGRGKDAPRERVEAALIVYTDDKAVPAYCTFKTTKCGVATSMKTGLDYAAKPDFAAISPEHAAAYAACMKPFMRVMGVVKLRRCTGKDSGKAYIAADATPIPTTQVEWNMLGELFASEDGQKAVKALSERFKSRTEFIESKA